MRDSDPTIYDVAERAGVSKSLVSLVLRGGAGVSPKRRLAVEAAIADLGYRPSLAAATLAGTSTRSIGVVVDDLTNLWYVSLIRGMEEALEGRRHYLTVTDTELNSRLGGSPVDGFLDLRAAGIVVAAEPSSAMVDALTRGGRLTTPTVVAGARAGVIPGADTVAIDEATGSRLAVEHLVSLGHRRIGHLTGTGGAAVHRLAGYDDAMRAAGLEPIVRGRGLETTEESGFAAAAALLDAEPGTTAILASNDVMALGALAALRDRGLSVPGDVSLVGYDDSPLAGARYLSLTSVDIRGAEVGAEVTRALLDRIADADAPQRDVRVAPQLVVRTSTGPARR